MKRITAAILVMLALVSTAGAQHTATVEVMRNEKWWGLYVSGGPDQPLVVPFDADTSAPYPAGRHVPLLVSSAGRYIWSDKPFRAAFDGRTLTINSTHEKVTVRKGGKSLREAYLVGCHKHFPPLSAPPDPSLFTMPLYLTELEFGHAQGQQEILDYASRLVREGFPAGILVIADGWQSVNGAYGFDRDLYPDPAGMVGKLHEMGFKVMLTVTPFIPMTGRNFVRALNSEELLMQIDGVVDEVLHIDGAYSALRNLAAANQYKAVSEGLEAVLRAVPVDGIRFDDDDILSTWDRQKVAAHRENWYRLGENVPMCDYSGGAAGAFPPYVSGIYPSPSAERGDIIASSISNVIVAGLTGLPFTHISPFLGGLPADSGDDAFMAAYLRVQAGMPVMCVDFAPWRIADQRLYAAVKEAFVFRASIGDYLEKLVRESAKTGEPVVRHMEYQFPRYGFADCGNQFMLGPKYLFAPCTGEGGKRNIRLPRGTWTDLNGQRFRGPVVIEADCSDFRSSVFEAAGK